MTEDKPWPERLEIGQEPLEIKGITVEVTGTNGYESGHGVATLQIQGASVEMLVETLMLDCFTGGKLLSSPVETQRGTIVNGVCARPTEDSGINLTISVQESATLQTPMSDLAEMTGTEVFVIGFGSVDKKGIDIEIVRGCRRKKTGP